MPPLVNENADQTDMHMNGSDDDEDDAGDDWNEMERDSEATKCLFCETVEESIEVAMDHLTRQHEFQLSAIVEKFNMDQYAYIKVRGVSDTLWETFLLHMKLFSFVR